MQSASLNPDTDCYVPPVSAVGSLGNYYHNDLLPESDLRISDSIRLTPSIVLPISEFNVFERVHSSFSSELGFENGIVHEGEFSQYGQGLGGYPDLEHDTTVSLLNPIQEPSENSPYIFSVTSNEDIQLSTLSMQSTSNETSSPISPFSLGTSIQDCAQPSLQTSDLTESSMVEYDELSSELSDSTASLSDMSTMSIDTDSIELEELCAGTLRPLMRMNNRRQPRRRMNRRQRTTIPKKMKGIILHLYERYNTETGASIVVIAYTITEQYLKPEFQ